MTPPQTDDTPILNGVNSPKDLKRLSHAELESLCAEIRHELIDVVSKNGGHLASNLGVVELTVALHCCFDAPVDKLIWDVGHQGYVHKLLTGRREAFKTLRLDDGCPGFLTRRESDYDVFGAGHAGTAISAALGVAAGRDQRNGTEKVIAIVGDGSMNCGTSFEGLNNVVTATRDMIIVLNDNKMSISKNVGALTNYLNNLISGRGYNRFKAFAKMMLKKIPHGEDIRKAISRFEEATKSLFVPGVIFEELGVRYIGPIDGHDLPEMLRTFEGVKTFNRPVIVHVITEKGRGYGHAEKAPENFHGMSSFNPETGICHKKSDAPTFSSSFGSALVELGEAHPEVRAITAAMSQGTGLVAFSKRFPDRFHDVGIAEEHAVLFACGLAVEGLRPVIAIYSTFLQRSLDYIYHDMCLQNLPVIICADRSGVVDDGPTHHGVYDLSFLKTLPNLSIAFPKDEGESRAMLFAAYTQAAPVVIKYPKGRSGREVSKDSEKSPPPEIPWGKAEVLREGSDLSILALGGEVATAERCATILAKSHDLSATVVNVRFIRPFDETLTLKLLDGPVVTIEDCHVHGGLGGVVDSVAAVFGKNGGIRHFGWANEVIPHGTTSEIKKKAGLTAERIATAVARWLKST